MALPPPPNFVLNAVLACGVPNLPLFDGQSPAERVTSEVFENDFVTCKNLTKEDLNDSIRSYANLTVANGRIVLNPLTKKRLYAMILWARGLYRVGQDPIGLPFFVADANTIIEKGKELQAFKDKAKTITDTAKPTTFTDKSDWLDWSETFKNFLTHIPGRSDIPLVYILRENVTHAIVEDPAKDLIHNLIDMAPLHGSVYNTDAAEVHTYIVKFIEGNVTAEAKIRSHSNQGNGRDDFMALKDHYKGVGFHAIAVTRAEDTISSMYYSREKFQMNWEKFERELNLAWATIDKKEGRVVYSDERKMRILFTKVKSADFLKTMCTTLETQILNPGHALTYDQCMTAFRNEVRKKFPAEATTTTRGRRVQQLGRGRGRGRGRGGRNFGNKRKNHQKERMVKGKSGKWHAIHPSYKLAKEVWNDLFDAKINKINNERAAFKRTRRGNDAPTVISQLTTDTNGIATIQVPVAMIQQAATNPTPTPANNKHTSWQNQSGGNNNPMGGRNEQAQLRSRNSGRS